MPGSPPGHATSMHCQQPAPHSTSQVLRGHPPAGGDAGGRDERPRAGRPDRQQGQVHLVLQLVSGTLVEAGSCQLCAVRCALQVLLLNGEPGGLLLRPAGLTRQTLRGGTLPCLPQPCPAHAAPRSIPTPGQELRDHSAGDRQDRRVSLALAASLQPTVQPSRNTILPFLPLNRSLCPVGAPALAPLPCQLTPPPALLHRCEMARHCLHLACACALPACSANPSWIFNSDFTSTSISRGIMADVAVQVQL